MRILITGSEGVLGRELKQELRRRGYEVFGCDLAHSFDAQVQRADVAEARQLGRIFKTVNPHLVYHLAAEFGRLNGHEYPEQLWRSNQIGTKNVIDYCLQFGAKLVLASSSEAYGESYDGDGALAEEILDRCAPLHHNEYALSKWVQERQVFIAAKNDGLKAAVLRFFNAYSKEEYSPYRSVVCLFMYRLMNNLPITVYRNYTRAFLYIDDLIYGIANVAERFDDLPRSTEMIGSRPGFVPVYNLGGREICSVEEVKDKIVALIGGSDSKITYLDKERANVTNKAPDISAAERDLGFNPQVTLDSGLPLAIAWMKERYGIKEKEAKVGS